MTSLATIWNRGRRAGLTQGRLDLDGTSLAYRESGAGDPMVLPNASHFVHEDNPQGVAEAIRSFCGAR